MDRQQDQPTTPDMAFVQARAQARAHADMFVQRLSENLFATALADFGKTAGHSSAAHVRDSYIAEVHAFFEKMYGVHAGSSQYGQD